MDDALHSALEAVCSGGTSLRDAWRFEWPESIQQALHRLALDAAGGSCPPLIALVGGASSGKSTVFNNLLEGHLTSRITARGHSTLGPILAVHEDHRPLVEELLAADRLLPGLRRASIELDGNACGEPDAVATVFHAVDALRGVLLFDLPDCTSQASHLEGDVSMSLLPWFDRLVVVVDPERWFDRQAISTLRAESVRFGQRRWALFNRTREDALSKEQRDALARQADRLGADGMGILEFRRGRGFCVFPPNTLDEVRAFLASPSERRTSAMLAQVAETANRLLNQNEERAGRLGELRSSLRTAVERTVPSDWACMTALMTESERKQLEVVSRVLRLHETRAWLSAQTRRVHDALKRLPMFGAMLHTPRAEAASDTSENQDRVSIGTSYYEAMGRRLAHEIQRRVRSSAFWDEMRRWTGIEPPGGGGEPPERRFEMSPARREEVRARARAFDEALARWNKKVEEECQGVAPSVKGAIGVGAVGLAVVLIAAPGPVSLLTLATAKGAIASALTKLAAAAGAGAMFGKPLGRLAEVVYEKLLGCAEFKAVRSASADFRARIESLGRELTDDAFAEAQALVLPGDHPLAEALERLRKPPESSK